MKGVDFMEAFTTALSLAWQQLGEGVDFVCERPYLLIASALGLVSYAIASAKRATRVSRH